MRQSHHDPTSGHPLKQGHRVQQFTWNDCPVSWSKRLPSNCPIYNKPNTTLIPWCISTQEAACAVPKHWCGSSSLRGPQPLAFKLLQKYTSSGVSERTSSSTNSCWRYMTGNLRVRGTVIIHHFCKENMENGFWTGKTYLQSTSDGDNAQFKQMKWVAKFRSCRSHAVSWWLFDWTSDSVHSSHLGHQGIGHIEGLRPNPIQSPNSNTLLPSVEGELPQISDKTMLLYKSLCGSYILWDAPY